MDERSLGKRLQVARTRAGLTQQALCERADLSYSTLTKIERGAIKSPSIFTIQNIAAALQVGLDELLGDSSHAAKRPPQKPRLQSESGVRFVYFDINGCLVRFFHHAFMRLSEDTGANPDVVETTFWHYNDQVCRGDISMQAFNAELAKVLGVPRVDWLEYYLDAVESIPAMREVVAWTADHYYVGLLSNIMPGFVPVLREHGLLPDVLYDAIIDSSEAKAIKPEAKIYEVATKAAHCKPSEILLIDDDRINLMAAEKHGWHVLWFDDYRPDESAERIYGALKPAA